jgi:hypothetical protein
LCLRTQNSAESKPVACSVDSTLRGFIISDQNQILLIQPSEYLANGFFDKNGQLIEGLNGYYSLAMAYRLRDEKADPDKLKEFLDRLQAIALKPNHEVDDHPETELDPGTLQEVKQLFHNSPSTTISTILEAAHPKTKNWKDLAALTIHLERILSEFVLIQSLAKAPSSTE